MLFPFGLTYSFEDAFSALVAMKTKSTNTMNVENDLICALSCIKPRISLLAKNKQTRALHSLLCMSGLLLKFFVFLFTSCWEYIFIS